MNKVERAASDLLKSLSDSEKKLFYTFYNLSLENRIKEYFDWIREVKKTFKGGKLELRGIINNNMKNLMEKIEADIANKFDDINSQSILSAVVNYQLAYEQESLIKILFKDMGE